MYNENTEVSNKTNESEPIKMSVTYCNQKIPPKKFAKALDAYIKKHGYPPPPTETIDVHVEGGKVVIRFVTLKESS